MRNYNNNSSSKSGSKVSNASSKSDSRSNYKSGKSQSGSNRYSKKRSSKSTGEYSDKPNFKEEGSNDPAWYSANASLLRDAASIPYSWALGTPVTINYGSLVTGSSFGVPHVTIPGIQVEYLIPSVGYSYTPTDPINVAANATYSFIRHANSGHSNYDSPDLMLYIMAMSQVYSYICFLQRLYGVATLYSQRNRYLPNALITAMNVDPTAVVDDLANLRYGINVLINKAASFAVPADMTYFARQAFIYQNVYTEGASAKDQLYMYCPHGFWKFNYNTTDSAGELVMKNFLPSDGASVSALLAFGTDMLNVLIQDEDMNIMSGDILKAYGSDKIVKLMPLTTEFPVTPIFNLQVLEQMKNATIIGHPSLTTFEYGVKQDASHAYLQSTPRAIINSRSTTSWVADAWRRCVTAFSCNKIITTSFSEATPELTMENTRLAVTAQGATYTAGAESSVTLNCGSEFAAYCKQYYYSVVTNATTGVDTVTLQYQVIEFIEAYGKAQDAAYTLEKLSRARSFKFQPAINIITFEQDGATANAKYVSSAVNLDVDNYAIAWSEDIKRLHEAALLNELHVPLIAKYSQ